MSQGEVLFTVPSDPALLRQILDVMKDAWSMPDYTEAVPVHMLKAILDNGGFLEAAVAEGRVVGFVLGFIGFDPEFGYYHYSHMLGVKKEFRGRNIALELKLRQRKWSVDRGYKVIIWTFDPHQGLNARFNFGKLGVISRRFYENYYGEIADGINVGLPTDRFKVEWWVLSKRVVDRLQGRDSAPTYDEVKDLAFTALSTKKESGVRVASRVLKDFSKELVLLEFPGDINMLRQECMECAYRWKLLFRESINSYLENKYIVVEHLSLVEEGERRNFYLLFKGSLQSILEGEYPWR
ncbi:MAG: GNAT family N-acetyltransferase [Infirmifilum sp.]